jgi:hypothetical protein
VGADSSANETFDVANGGSLSYTATSGQATISPGDADFSLVPGKDNCSNQQDIEDLNCTLSVQFNPTQTGSLTGTLNFPTSAGTFTVPLAGYAYPGGSAALDPTSLSFPEVVVGQDSCNTTYCPTVAVENNGVIALTLGTPTGVNATVGGSSSTNDFTIAKSCNGVTIEPGSRCTATVDFIPQAAGARNGSVTFPVTYADQTTASLLLTLTGTGVAATKTTTSVGTNINPSIYGQALIFTATVQSNGSTTPSGSVTFTANGQTISGCSAVPVVLFNTSIWCDVSALQAGSYSIVATYSGDDEYAGSASQPLTQVVKAAVLTVKANNASRMYGAQNPAFTYIITGFVNGDGLGVVSGSPAFTTTANATSPIGDYPITITKGSLSAANYTFVFVNGTLTVTKAVPALTWAAPAAIAFGTPLSATQLDATANVAGSFVYNPALGKVLSVGTQTLGVTFTPKDTTDYSTATGTVTLQVNQATPKITWATPAAITYGTKLSATQLDATSVTPGKFVYSPALGAVLPTGSQTLSVTLNPTDATGYAPATASVTLTVKPAALTVTANAASRPYGAANPTFTDTITGFANGDTAATAVTGSANFTTTATAQSKVGTYPITIAAGTLAAANYTFNLVNGTLTVSKASLTATAQNATMTYGGGLPAFTYVLSGFINGDKQSSATTGAPKLTTTATAASGVGTYPITIAAGTLTAPNYAVNYVSGMLTIGQAALQVNANSLSKVYGAANPALTYTLKGLVNGDTAAKAVTGAPLLTTTSTAGSPVGSYPISIAAGTMTAKNYTLQFNGSTLAVSAAKLTVTANSLSMKQGASVPALTYTMKGFVNGDTQATATSGAPVLSTTATSKSVPGSYPITVAAATLAASNYSFTLVNGTMTVTK